MQTVEQDGNDFYQNGSRVISRKRAMEMTDSFISMAEKDGIEKIKPRIERAFFGDGVGQGNVERQLMRWVNTRTSHRFGKAKPYAKFLYDYLFVNGEA